MANGNDRTPALQNEDWWACFIGWFILLIAIIGVHEVAAGKWAVSILPAAPRQEGRCGGSNTARCAPEAC